MTAEKRRTLVTIRRIAASDRISGLIMLGFALPVCCRQLAIHGACLEQLEEFA